MRGEAARGNEYLADFPGARAQAIKKIEGSEQFMPLKINHSCSSYEVALLECVKKFLDKFNFRYMSFA